MKVYIVLFSLFASAALAQNAAITAFSLSIKPRDPINPVFSVCIYGVNDNGEYSCGGIPVSYDARFFCGATAANIGNSICSIHSPRGVARFPYTIAKVADDGGGQCGYYRSNVTCHYVNPTVPRAEGMVFPHCGSAEAAAKAFCASLKPSSDTYQFYLLDDGPGGQCGHPAYTVRCY